GQRIGSCKPAELHLAEGTEHGLARSACNEEPPQPLIIVGPRLEQFMDLGPLLVGVRGDCLAMLERRQHTLEIIPYHQRPLRLEQLARPLILLLHGPLLEVGPLEVGAEHLHGPYRSTGLLEAHEARPIREEPRPAPPERALPREARLTHAA